MALIDDFGRCIRSPNRSMFNVNGVAPMVGCAEQVMALQHGCADNASLEGDLLSHPIPKGKWPLCDKTIGDDAGNTPCAQSLFLVE